MGKQYAPKNPSRRNGGKKLNIIAIELVACFVLTAVLIGTVIGKYRQQFNSYGSVRALDFYFISDFLSDGAIIPTHTLAPGTAEFSFTLGNHADDLRCAEMDIAYEVTVTKEGEEAGTTPSVSFGDNSKTLTKDKKEDDTVTISDLTAGTYTITAVGTGKNTDASASGYTKTLKAKIVIRDQGAKLCYHQENEGEYILLTVWNEGESEGTVNITYTGIPDNTNPNMTDWEDGSETKQMKSDIQIDKYESKVFRFFGGTVTVENATLGIPK